MPEFRVGFIGSGRIAQYHAYALQALPFYYADAPVIHRVAVGSPTRAHREQFAARYGFAFSLAPEELLQRTDLDTLFVLSPNALHLEHLQQALENPSIRNIYVEKPLCANVEERDTIAIHLFPDSEGRVLQLGFQFLQMSSIRKAYSLWQSGTFGRPIHFSASYLHNGYLRKAYRKSRPERLAPSPSGGAMADLGSHLLSILVSFFGEGLEITAARHSRGFEDVDPLSDLCSVLLLHDKLSGAVGTLAASRISAGAGECLELQIRCTDGGFRLSTEHPDQLQVFCGNDVNWRVLHCGSDYLPDSDFPALHASAGWLRSLVHAHHVFFCGGPGIPSDLTLGLQVERLICQAAQLMHRNGVLTCLKS